MNKEQLVASLRLAVDEQDGIVAFDDGRFVEWSTARDGDVDLEVGQGVNSHSIRLSWDEMAQLHTALTLCLLAREK